MIIKRLASLLILLAAALPALRASGTAECDTCSHHGKTYWIKQLIDNGFHIHDTTVCYPRFPRFALKVYNWGDRTFNSYDTAYVVGTGKNWKLMGKSFNWLETSTMLFPENLSLDMHSNVYADAGFSLSFMAVSVGYMWNMNQLFSHPTSRHTFNLQFTTSRFSASFSNISSEGGMIITRLGNFRNHSRLHYRFDDVRLNTKQFDLVYFFNHNRYSHGAAYAYSKYQLRSAGTALVGILYSEQKMEMNFSSLPPEMQENIPLDNLNYSFHYRAYSAQGGYTYNLVLKPRRWLINFFGSAAVGYRQIFGTREQIENESRKARNLMSNTVQANIAAVYNHRALFLALTARYTGYFCYNTQFNHINSYPSLTAVVGMRF